MSGFLGKFKEASTTLVNKTTAAAAEIWDKHGDSIALKALQICYEMAKYGRQQITDNQKYQQHVIDRLWDLLPPPLRLFGRDRIGWDSKLFGLRDKIFLIDGENVKVRPDAKEQITATLKSVFGVHSDASLEANSGTNGRKCSSS
ncbi:hypothetical protein [Methylomicrobium lacus]|uniref:hypothetical protein n=1 Tax=Methylomicrobium lacus TaxID=136992 RepID=UPI0035A887B1